MHLIILFKVTLKYTGKKAIVSTIITSIERFVNRRIDKTKLYNGNYAVDCSSYVTWVLYEYALANGKTDMKNYFSYQRNRRCCKKILQTNQRR